MDERDFEESYYMYEAYKEKIEELMKEKMEADESLAKLRITFEAIEELSKAKDGSMFAPLGGSAYIPVRRDGNGILVGIGSGYAIEAEPERAMKIIRERMERVSKASKDLNNEIIKARQEMDRLAEKLKAFMEKNHDKFSD